MKVVDKITDRQIVALVRQYFGDRKAANHRET
jgi:hypothetical protein